MNFYIVMLFAFLGFAQANVNMDMTQYPGKTHTEQLASAEKCMNALRVKVLPYIKSDLDGYAGNCLRYAFHDCGTYDKNNPISGGGCNGGIRKTIANAVASKVYDTAKNPNPQDNGMLNCQSLLVGMSGNGGLCTQVRLENPLECGKMSFADCISFSGYLAVVATGGAPVSGCGWLPGRVDVEKVQETTRLPSEHSNAYNLQDTFGKYGMEHEKFGLHLNETVVLLSGGHTIGSARVHPEDICNKGNDKLTATPKKFDKDYYVGVVSNMNKLSDNGGWFCSDMHGLCNTIKYKDYPNITQRGLKAAGKPPLDLNIGYCDKADSPLAPFYFKYAQSPNSLFLSNFCKAYQAMSLIGYNMPRTYFAEASKFAYILTDKGTKTA